MGENLFVEQKFVSDAPTYQDAELPSGFKRSVLKALDLSKFIVNNTDSGQSGCYTSLEKGKPICYTVHDAENPLRLVVNNTKPAEAPAEPAEASPLLAIARKTIKPIQEQTALDPERPILEAVTLKQAASVSDDPLVQKYMNIAQKFGPMAHDDLRQKAEDAIGAGKMTKDQYDAILAFLGKSTKEA